MIFISTIGKDRALEALLTCRTLKEVSEVSEVPARTLYHWLHEDADFREAYTGLRQQGLREIADKAGDRAGEALDTLSEIMRDSNERGSVRVSAARAILDIYEKMAWLVDVSEQAAAVEALLKNRV